MSTASTYHQFHCSLSKAQIRKLAQGGKIRLRATDLNHAGDDVLHLTLTQHNKLLRARRLNKGMEISLSEPQIREMATMGSGRLGDFFKKVKDVASNIGSTLKPAAQFINSVAGDELSAAGRSLGGVAIDTLAKEASKSAKDLLSKNGAPGFVGSWTDKGFDLGNRLAKDQLAELIKGIQGTVTGSGLLHEMRGAGLFDFIPGVGGVLNELGNTAWGIGKNVAIPIATGMLTKRLGGGCGRGRGRPRKNPVGQGLYIPGVK